MPEVTKSELREFKEDVERAKEEASMHVPSWARDMNDDEYGDYFAQLAGHPLNNQTKSSSEESMKNETDLYRASLTDSQQAPSRQHNRMSQSVPLTSLSQASTLWSIPGSHDTPLFAIPIKRGEGNVIIHQIMIKCLSPVGSADRLSPIGGQGILSVFTPEKESNYLYIEAVSKRHLLNAIAGLSDIYRSELTTVPIVERRKVLASCIRKGEIFPGDYARFRSLLGYKNDLCQVMDITESKVVVRTIPRVDFTDRMVLPVTPKKPVPGKLRISLKNKPMLTAQSQEIDISSSSINTSKELTLPQRFFSSLSVPDAEKVGDFWQWNSSVFTSDGFLVKTVTPSQLILREKMSPISAQELAHFERTPDVESASSQKSAREQTILTNSQQIHSYNSGDMVLVVHSTYRGMKGSILQADSKKLVVRMEDSREVVHLDVEEVRPYHELNSNIIVLIGPHKGKTGTVIAHLPALDSLVVHTEDTGAEVQLLTSEVENCSRHVPLGEAARKSRKLFQHEYREGDLVELVDETALPSEEDAYGQYSPVAYVLKVTSHYLICLKLNNAVTQVDPKKVQKKYGQLMQSFRDKRDTIVHVGECVRVVSDKPGSVANALPKGSSRKRVAIVKAIWDDFVFVSEADTLHDNTITIVAEKQFNVIGVNRGKSSTSQESGSSQSTKMDQRLDSTVVHPGILYNFDDY